VSHRFLTDGFLAALDPAEALLYLFLILAADRNGLSYYGYDAICNLSKLPLEQYIQARDGLIEKDLIKHCLEKGPGGVSATGGAAASCRPGL
jgi:hypothetical protein